MDELNWKELEQIPIPEGLEDRLSAKIDEWERAEQKTRKPRLKFSQAMRYAAIAASVVLLFGVGYYTFRSVRGDSVATPPFAEQDTYHDPTIAQQEATKALHLLAINLNKGMGQLERAKAISERTEKTLNKQLKVMSDL